MASSIGLRYCLIDRYADGGDESESAMRTDIYRFISTTQADLSRVFTEALRLDSLTDLYRYRSSSPAADPRR